MLPSLTCRPQKGINMNLGRIFGSCTLLALIGLSLPTMAEQAGNLKAEPVVLNKPAAGISEAAGNFLKSQPGSNVKIWIFFNDKGVFDMPSFEAKAAELEIDRHGEERRHRAGIDGATFADLPVNQEYIHQIINSGGKLRRISRWLNAASFEISKDRVDAIGNLACVNRIEPVATFKSIQETSEPAGEIQMKPNAADALSYGLSAGQLQMINVPALHNQGFNGKGVIVAMLDTGFRKTHEAFAPAFAGSRVIAEHDFIFNDGNTDNEAGDALNQHDHGTYTWSTLGGDVPGKLYGPAYGASFILAKTEDVRSETPVEEDNWVAALEWVDSLGADVISSSLGYSDWYVYGQMDGQTATITIAANTAAGLGIIVCNSMGNSGPAAGTLSAPADAFNILACGAVNSGRTIADFSSRGPTFDGRTKPEVCAQGVSTYCASAGSNSSYAYVSGTSLSTPLVGGAAALLLSANPALNPFQIRKTFMMTADRALSPDNDYGWGIIDVLKAYNWGANFTAAPNFGYDTLTVTFADSSTPGASAWKWYFGDGDSSMVQNPSHHYSTAGSYDVSLYIESSEGPLARLKEGYVAVVADTLTFATDSAFAGKTAVISVNLKNTQEIDTIIIPVEYASGMEVSLDSARLGTRTSQFELIHELYRDDASHRVLLELIADNGGGAPLLEAGSGEVARLYFKLDSMALPGAAADIDTALIDGRIQSLANYRVNYLPRIAAGQLLARYIQRGDANNTGVINILDISYLINYLYKSGPAPVTFSAGDANSTLNINILDVSFLINYLYKGGPAPANP
ncbi:putative Subtilisin [Candidatus Zixiibacteriota bacterium]|nr:putative Subtilisin [candidate division Zixibacteria bacterium]